MALGCAFERRFFLVGNAKNAAYLANVCTATPARRQGIGNALITKARALARDWGKLSGLCTT